MITRIGKDHNQYDLVLRNESQRLLSPHDQRNQRSRDDEQPDQGAEGSSNQGSQYDRCQAPDDVPQGPKEVLLSPRFGRGLSSPHNALQRRSSFQPDDRLLRRLFQLRLGSDASALRSHGLSRRGSELVYERSFLLNQFSPALRLQTSVFGAFLRSVASSGGVGGVAGIRPGVSGFIENLAISAPNPQKLGNKPRFLSNSFRFRFNSTNSSSIQLGTDTQASNCLLCSSGSLMRGFQSSQVKTPSQRPNAFIGQLRAIQ